jgi:hypothetical protein
MNYEDASVTILLDYYNKLKNCEEVIEEIKDKYVFLVVVKTENKCGYEEYYEVCNIDKIDSFAAEKQKRLQECNDVLFEENMKLKNITIWQLLKRKLSLLLKEM